MILLSHTRKTMSTLLFVLYCIIVHCIAFFGVLRTEMSVFKPKRVRSTLQRNTQSMYTKPGSGSHL